MKKNYFFFLDGKLFIGISLPREITEQKMSDFLQISPETERMYSNRVRDLVEGQVAIVAILEDADAEYKTGFLPVEEYLEILEGPVFTAINAALYIYDVVDSDREKLIQRTRALFAFVLGYVEVYAFSNEEIGDQIIRNEIFVFLEVLQANQLEVDWSGDFFKSNELIKQYIDTWYPE